MDLVALAITNLFTSGEFEVSAFLAIVNQRILEKLGGVPGGGRGGADGADDDTRIAIIFPGTAVETFP